MKTRLEFKVGLFVLLGLALLAVLMLQFSKGVSFLHSSYTIHLRSHDVGGLRERASVLMSGVQVGSVSKLRLVADGKSVIIDLKIQGDYKIHKDARFLIEQSGFLGDQYVAVQPTENQEGILKEGDVAQTEPPFNLQQAARSASNLIQRLDETAQSLGNAITDIHRLLLNEQNLTNLAGTISNLRTISERALEAIDRIDGLVASNTPALNQSGANVAVFSQQLISAGGGLTNLLAANTPVINDAIKNFERSSDTLRQMLADVRDGKGPAGTLLRDQAVADNLAALSRNLAVTSSNLNRLGLWGILWKRKPPPEETDREFERLLTPKQEAR